MRARLAIPLLLLAATPALAVDGVVELNATCATASGCAPGDAAGFPIEISRSGSYRLTSNLDVRAQPASVDVTVIRIRANDVTLDLNGFALIGGVICTGTPTVCSAAGTGVGVLADSTDALSNLVVRNGTIRGMGSNGIQLETTSVGEGFEVSGVRAISNGARGIRLSSSGTSSLTGCRAERNATFGISAVGAGGLIKGNVVSNNGGTGINASGYLISENVVVSNVFSGIIGGSNGLISNVLSGNSPNIGVGTVQLGPNLCNGALCP